MSTANNTKDVNVSSTGAETAPVPSTSPPSYDYATGSSNAPQPINPFADPVKHDIASTKSPPPAMPQPSTYPLAPGLNDPSLYHYRGTLTGDVISTPLPPDHPQMICLQQGHVTSTKFGLLGILAAVFWFPWGIACCLLDRRAVCRRCGLVLDDGVTC